MLQPVEQGFLHRLPVQVTSDTSWPALPGASAIKDVWAAIHALRTVPLLPHMYTQVVHYGKSAALRCLALACRPWGSERLDVRPEDEAELTLVG